MKRNKTEISQQRETVRSQGEEGADRQEAQKDLEEASRWRSATLTLGTGSAWSWAANTLWGAGEGASSRASSLGFPGCQLCCRMLSGSGSLLFQSRRQKDGSGTNGQWVLKRPDRTAENPALREGLCRSRRRWESCRRLGTNCRGRGWDKEVRRVTCECRDNGVGVSGEEAPRRPAEGEGGMHCGLCRPWTLLSTEETWSYLTCTAGRDRSRTERATRRVVPSP